MKRKLKRSLHSGIALLSLGFLLAHHVAGAVDPLPRINPARAGFSATALQRIDRFYNREQIAALVYGAMAR